LAIDKSGALLIADRVGNTIWRVAAAGSRGALGKPGRAVALTNFASSVQQIVIELIRNQSEAFALGSASEGFERW
jgi:hypothetical protein